MLNRTLKSHGKLSYRLNAKTGNKHGIVKEIRASTKASNAGKPLRGRIDLRLQIKPCFVRRVEKHRSVLSSIGFEHHQRVGHRDHARDR